MALLVGWVIFAIIIGAIAAGKGRSFIGWTLIACIVSPLIAIILVAVISPANRGDRRQERQFQRHGSKECPDCSEQVLGTATVCKHCGYRFDLYGNLGTRRFEQIEDNGKSPAIALRALAETDGAPVNHRQMATIVDYISEGNHVTDATWSSLAQFVADLPSDQTSIVAAVRQLRSLSRGERKRFLRAMQRIIKLRRAKSAENAERFQAQLERALT